MELEKVIPRPWWSFGERWFAWRNRLLSNPRFQRWAATFPLTRGISRRRATAIFDLCAGFVYSQVLLAGVRVGLFEVLAEGPRTIAEVARELSLPLESTRRLLHASAALRLTERRGPELFGLGIHGAALIGNPAVARMVEHHALLYRDLVDPVALLRGERTDTELRRFWTYHGASPSTPPTDAQVADYSALMGSSQSLIAEDIIEAYALGGHRRLLDVGGGDGSFLTAVAGRFPELGLMLFDLPPVAARARAGFARAGLETRTEVVGGDVFRDPLPGGADVISLVRVLHDHDDPQALQILRAIHKALPPEGRLVLAEPMSETPSAEPVGDAYFGFYLLAMGRGRPRSPGVLSQLLGDAGFEAPEFVPTRRPLLTQLLVTKPISRKV